MNLNFQGPCSFGIDNEGEDARFDVFYMTPCPGTGEREVGMNRGATATGRTWPGSVGVYEDTTTEGVAGDSLSVGLLVDW